MYRVYREIMVDIDFNTSKTTTAKSDLKRTGVFGKTMENLGKILIVKLITSPKKVTSLSSRRTYVSHKLQLLACVVWILFLQYALILPQKDLFDITHSAIANLIER